MHQRLATRFAAPAAIGAILLISAPAMAAQTLAGPITGWQKGGEPTWTSMYEYLPPNFQPGGPILVHVHYCSGNAPKAFQEAQGGGVVTAADKYGFMMIVPQTSQNCWDVATKASLTHDGGGDTGAIVNMVKYAVAQHKANPDRVYVTGTSSGAMAVQALLAVYPDVFKGGSEFAGVPAGCWSVNNPNGQWSSPCAGGQVTHTAVDWGNMVRAMYPGYSGFRPRIQLWHGDADTAISYTNQTEAIKEWTNVFSVAATPTATMMTTINNHAFNHLTWKDSCGYTVLDVYNEPGGPHGTDADMNATYVIPFLTLDKPGAVDAQVAMCGNGGGTDGGVPGSGGSGGGANGAGGSQVGSGGATGSGGAMNVGSAGNAGAGQITSGGSGGDVGMGGSPDTTTGMDTPDGSATERPGCSCKLADAPSGAPAGLLWGLVALSAAFVRRRRASS